MVWPARSITSWWPALTPSSRRVRSRLLISLVGAALSLALVPAAAVAQAIVIGAKEFTEQLLISEMTSQLLRAHGFDAHKGTGFATTGIRTLQERGIIDLYWEYTGTSLTTFNQVTEKLSPEETYERVKALDAQAGVGLACTFEGEQHLRSGNASSRCSSKTHQVHLRSRCTGPRGRGDAIGFDS